MWDRFNTDEATCLGNRKPIEGWPDFEALYRRPDGSYFATARFLDEDGEDYCMEMTRRDADVWLVHAEWEREDRLVYPTRHIVEATAPGLEEYDYLLHAVLLKARPEWFVADAEVRLSPLP